MDRKTLNKTAVSTTLHCLTGCGTGEILGLVIGEVLGLGVGITIILAVGLAFVFGYALTTLPLSRAGLSWRAAFRIALAVDTLSIAVMEIVDNAAMLLVPGALNTGLANPLFWISLAFALVAAFFAALPVNRYLLTKGKGHALIHKYHDRH
ncbi:MAG TPA: DUF4396 domain-containing protein [Candidatus Saccharimonadia bacterium]